MNKLKWWLVVLIFGLIMPDVCRSISFFKPNSLGTVVVGTRQDASQMPSSGMGPGILVCIKYNLSPSTFMSLGAGISTVTDDFMKMENFKTVLLPSTELKMGLKLASETKLAPMIYTGLHMFGHMDKFRTPTGIINSDQYYDAGVMIGGGIEYHSTDQWAFYVGGDYRYIFSSDKNPSPQYWVAQAGVHFSIKPQDEKLSPEEYYREDKKEKMVPSTDKNEIAMANKSVKQTTQDHPQKRKLTEKQKRYLAYLYNKKKKEEQKKQQLALTQNEASQSTQNMPSIQKRNQGNLKNYNQIKQVYSNIVYLENTIDEQDQVIEKLQSRIKSHEKVLSNIARVVVSDYIEKSEEVNQNQQTVPIVNYEESYQLALDKVRSKDFRSAISIFKSLLAYNNKHPLASNCQYWIGESYHAIQEYENAITAFNSVLEYQISYKLDDALLMNGLCHMKMGHPGTAKKYFEELIERYPESEYVPRARNYLVSL